MTTATLDTNAQTQSSDVQMQNIPLALLVPFPMGNLRGKRSEAKMASLKNDMALNGLIQPIVVRHITTTDTFQVLAGFGRWENAKTLTWENIACRIYSDISDSEALAIHIAENFQRESLSIVAEADAAQKFFAMFQGDMDAAASQLSMNRRAFVERLEINRCSDFVKDKLELKEISTGHALIAASFPAQQQDKIIEFAISGKLTIADLKRVVGKAHRQLSEAKFSLDACNGCEFNTKRQESLGLFEDEQEKNSQGECTNGQCYQTKTNEWVEVQRKQAEERFGTVILFSSVGNALSTLTEKVVGEAQFKKGCASCESNCAVMDDRADRLGVITENQCIDQSCFADKTTAKTKADKEIKKQAVKKTKTVAATSSTPKDEKVQEAGEPSSVDEVTYTTHKRVVMFNKAELRKASAKHFENNPTFQLATMLASLTRTTGYKLDGSTTFDTVFIKALSLSTKELQTHIQKAVTHMANSADNEMINFTDIMIKALSTEKSDGKAVAVAQWAATKESLENYTTSTLSLLLADAKFDVFYNEKEGDGSFAKLVKGKKSDLIESVLDSGFDWTDFAPRDYLETLK